jgi:very-short-patch-repair endonuclease
MRITQADLFKQGYTIIDGKAVKVSEKPKATIKAKQVKSTRGDAQKIYMEHILEQTGETFVKEHKFHPTRKWRFDFSNLELKCAIEYEGLFAAKSRHTTATGFTGDAEKYNQATILGWKVLRYTALNYKQLETDVKALIDTHKQFF